MVMDELLASVPDTDAGVESMSTAKIPMQLHLKAYQSVFLNEMS